MYSNCVALMNMQCDYFKFVSYIKLMRDINYSVPINVFLLFSFHIQHASDDVVMFW